MYFTHPHTLNSIETITKQQTRCGQLEGRNNNPYKYTKKEWLYRIICPVLDDSLSALNFSLPLPREKSTQTVNRGWIHLRLSKATILKEIQKKKLRKIQICSLVLFK